MRRNGIRRLLAMPLAAAISFVAAGSPSEAYLYWVKPDFSGAIVRGDEPGIVVPLSGATAAETQANLVWSLRAALNVAALQCQFSAPLMTVRNYNTLLSQHSVEFASAYKMLGSHFKRTLKKNWQRAFDAHTTRTYNGFSTMHAQIGFCETAGKIGRLALATRKGELHSIATSYMREIRNSLIPTGDRMFAISTMLPPVAALPLDDRCWDRGGNIKKKCVPAGYAAS